MNVTIPTIADSAMLVYVQVRMWSARKLDKKQTAKTIEEANATRDAARVNKHLLANADSKLKEVQRKANEIRDFLDTNTLPWDKAGNRIISNAHALIAVGKLENLRKDFEELADDFVADYPALREQAIANLGDMGEHGDYPAAGIVRAKFGVKIEFSPVPTNFGDVRVGMSQQQAQAWQAHFEDNVKSQVADSLKAAWARLREDLEKYSDRLTRDPGDDKGRIFRDTMVTNLRETCALLSSLNIFGDEELAKITSKVSLEIAKYEPDVLRTNVGAATQVKAEVDDLLKQMQGLFGA